MRVLHVNASFGRGGGTESYLSQVVRDLRWRGHQAVVAAEQDAGGEPDIPCHLLEAGTLGDRTWSARQASRFEDVVRASDPEIIHLHNTTSADLVARSASLRPTMRFVHDHTVFCPGLNKEYTDGGLCDRRMGEYCLERWHGEGCLCFRHPSLEIAQREVRATERLLDEHRRLARLMVASRYMKDELKRVELPAERIVVNPYYAEDTGLVAPLPESPVIVTLCRIVHPDKGIAVLLEALALLDTPFRARIVGEGPDLPAMKARAVGLGLADRVEFTGFLPHALALAQIAAATVVAFPSVWQEPFGIVGIEAMAAARAVVAFDVGAVGEWMDPGQTGLLVQRADAQAFAHALAGLLRNPERARALGAEGRSRFLGRFTRERHLDVLEATYREVAGA